MLFFGDTKKRYEKSTKKPTEKVAPPSASFDRTGNYDDWGGSDGKQTRSHGHRHRAVDHGFEDAEGLTAKATLAVKFNELLERRGPSQTEAAAITGMTQPKVSQEIGRASCRERVLWVTGVQTCALPISCREVQRTAGKARTQSDRGGGNHWHDAAQGVASPEIQAPAHLP